MKKILLSILMLAFMCFNTTIRAESYSFKKETYQFSIKDGQTLSLDKYTPQTIQGEMPCIIFMFGGAFARGARDVEKYMPYFDFLVKHGYAVISIDYRLGLKELATNKNFPEEELVKMLVNSINMAVEDLYDATNFVIKRANEWNIDTDNIILNGSSAGAVTVLQAEYDLCNQNPLSVKMPAGFRYKGVIAFAGAILTFTDGLTWQKEPCPMMLMHGDADLQVPYYELKVENTGFYGARYIAESFESRNFPYYFHSFTNYGHEIASNPMQDNKYEIMHFLDNFVKNKKRQQIAVKEDMIGKPEVKKDFTLYDYLNGNFPQ